MFQSDPQPLQVRRAQTFRPELAFPDLTEDMLVRLLEYGREDIYPKDTLLFTRGERNVDMFVILRGAIDIYAVSRTDDRTPVVTLQERQFTGELDLLSGRSNLVEGRTACKRRFFVSIDKTCVA